jgi:hypothetical protein
MKPAWLLSHDDFLLWLIPKRLSANILMPRWRLKSAVYALSDKAASHSKPHSSAEQDSG